MNNNELTSAVIVEPRNHKALIPVINNVRRVIGDKIPIHLLHGLSNRSLAYKIKDSINNIILKQLDINNLTIKDYNILLTSKDFYNILPDGKTMIFQTDSGFCKPNIHSKFLEYDYIGGPWRNTPLSLARAHISPPRGGLLVGNGGLSIRNPRLMEKIIETDPYDPNLNLNLPEDVYFSYNCKKINECKLAPLKLSKKFSIDGRINKYDERHPVGFHKHYGCKFNNGIYDNDLFYKRLRCLFASEVQNLQ